MNINEIVLIADRTFKKQDTIDVNADDLEMISDEYFFEIEEQLKKIFKNFKHYNSPKEFIENIAKHKNSIVFTIFGGLKSRNRMALVPAICESYNIKFVGADAYSRIVCQDKFLSKELAKRNNLKTPNSLLINDLSKLQYVYDLSLPLVVKPNFEGSSIGIFMSEPINDYIKCIDMSKILYEKFKQPILIEEFVEGKEVTINIIGSETKILLLEAMEIQYEKNPNFFKKRLYTAYDKYKTKEKIVHKKITQQIPNIDLINIKELFLSLGKMDFMRIDGRLNESGFYLLELTPDSYLGKESSMVEAGKVCGMSYLDVIISIISTSLEYYHIPYSNCIKN